MSNSDTESWSMSLSSINAAKAAIEVGIENTTELLIDWETRFGRTTRSNRMTAERLELDITQMQSALARLDEADGRPYGGGPDCVATFEDGTKKEIVFGNPIT